MAGNGLVSIPVLLAVGIFSLIGRVLVLGTGVLLARLRPDDEIVVTWFGVRIVPHPTRIPTEP